MPSPRHQLRPHPSTAHGDGAVGWAHRPKPAPARPIKQPVKLTGKCPVCGRGNMKQKIFEERFSPLNRNPDGSIRTEAQIRARLNLAASAWRPDFTHDKCKEK